LFKIIAESGKAASPETALSPKPTSEPDLSMKPLGTFPTGLLILLN
jgi:hypothetical protein